MQHSSKAAQPQPTKSKAVFIDNRDNANRAWEQRATRPSTHLGEVLLAIVVYFRWVGARQFLEIVGYEICWKGCVACYLACYTVTMWEGGRCLYWPVFIPKANANPNANANANPFDMSLQRKGAVPADERNEKLKVGRGMKNNRMC